jgi:hypothetical protein
MTKTAPEYEFVFYLPGSTNVLPTKREAVNFKKYAGYCWIIPGLRGLPAAAVLCYFLDGLIKQHPVDQ